MELVFAPIWSLCAISKFIFSSSWSPANLIEKVGEKAVSVEVTPDGRGDAVDSDGKMFIMPETQSMTLSQFWEKSIRSHASKPTPSPVYYISQQNGNFRSEFEMLSDDIKEPQFAREAFGEQPDAVNLWIGPAAAVTSLHKDHYENIYCVLRGRKIFTLFPPMELPYLHETAFESAQYKQLSDDSFTIVPCEPRHSRPWIPVDPAKPDFQRFPLFKHARAITVEVNEGDVFYLPSLWFHQVGTPPSQSLLFVSIVLENI
jgi:jumonji domain-containing protein 7